MNLPPNNPNNAPNNLPNGGTNRRPLPGSNFWSMAKYKVVDLRNDGGEASAFRVVNGGGRDPIPIARFQIQVTPKPSATEPASTAPSGPFAHPSDPPKSSIAPVQASQGQPSLIVVPSSAPPIARSQVQATPKHSAPQPASTAYSGPSASSTELSMLSTSAVQAPAAPDPIIAPSSAPSNARSQVQTTSKPSATQPGSSTPFNDPSTSSIAPAQGPHSLGQSPPIVAPSSALFIAPSSATSVDPSSAPSSAPSNASPALPTIPNVLPFPFPTKAQLTLIHRRLKLLKLEANTAKPLLPSVPEFNALFSRAKAHVDHCQLYKDPRIKPGSLTGLFNPAKLNEVPQRVSLRRRKEIEVFYNCKWPERTRPSQKIVNEWHLIKQTQAKEEWIELAARIDEEQLTQLKMGIIYSPEGRDLSVEVTSPPLTLVSPSSPISGGSPTASSKLSSAADTTGLSHGSSTGKSFGPPSSGTTSASSTSTYVSAEPTTISTESATSSIASGIVSATSRIVSDGDGPSSYPQFGSILSNIGSSPIVVGPFAPSYGTPSNGFPTSPSFSTFRTSATAPGYPPNFPGNPMVAPLPPFVSSFTRPGPFPGYMAPLVATPTGPTFGPFATPFRSAPAGSFVRLPGPSSMSTNTFGPISNFGSPPNGPYTTGPSPSSSGSVFTSPVLTNRGPSSTAPKPASTSSGPSAASSSQSTLSPNKFKNYPRSFIINLKRRASQPLTPLVPGTPEFKELFAKAKEYCETSPIYKDPEIVTFDGLFDPNKEEFPQEVELKTISGQYFFFSYHRKKNGTGNGSQTAYSSMKRSDPDEYYFWIKLAQRVDEEQLKQLKMGFIYGDKDRKYGAPRQLERKGHENGGRTEEPRPKKRKVGSGETTEEQYDNNDDVDVGNYIDIDED